ncbi:MAG: coproporphyrinogen III oxidase, partial [Methylocystis sp.]
RHGYAEDAFDAAQASLEALADDGVIDVHGRRLAVTERGKPFVRLVAAAFDAYLQSAPARHSSAV